MDRKNAGNEGGYDLVVMCKFSYSMDGMTYRSLGIPFRVKEGRWIGAKQVYFVLVRLFKRMMAVGLMWIGLG